MIDRRKFIKMIATYPLLLGMVEKAYGRGMMSMFFSLVGGWGNWDEASEATLASNDIFVVLYENVNNGGNEIGQGGGLSLPDLELTQAGAVAGATGSPPTRVMDGINDAFTCTQTLADTLIANANNTWSIIYKIHTLPGANKVLHTFAGVGAEDVYIEAQVGREILFRLEEDGGGDENKTTADPAAAAGDVYICFWADGSEARGGFVDSGSPNGATKPTKLSDFNANDRVLFAANTGNFSGEAFGNAQSMFSGGGTFFGCTAYYTAIAKTSLIDNAL